MVRRREPDEPEELTEEQEAELADDMAAAWVQTPDDSAFSSEEEKVEAWRLHGGRITGEYVAAHPGRRPPGWWRFEAPRDRPVFVEDRPEGAPRDLSNEAAWLLELGELSEGERGRCPPPNPAERACMEGE